MSGFVPRFTISNAIAMSLTSIERARGFLDAATLSEEWIRRMSEEALLLEAHHTTHIEGTELSLDDASRLGHLGDPGLVRTGLSARDGNLVDNKPHSNPFQD